MRRALPPLNALRAFEAVARLQSVKLAAEELHVTHGAVSHQLKMLEESLGMVLFHRDRRQLRLNQTGLVYSRQVREALRLLAESTIKLGLPSVEGRLQIICAPTLATKWLAHQLKAFRSAFLPTTNPIRSASFVEAGCCMKMMAVTGNAGWLGWALILMI